MRVHWLEQTNFDAPATDDWLSAAEQARLIGMRVPKRRGDWRLGRWAAKLAVTAYLNLPQHQQLLAQVEIRPTDSGVPQAFVVNEPAGVSISISHRADRAVCAVAPPGTMLGCDVEVIEHRSDAFLSDYFTEDEQELIAGAVVTDRDRIANLLWSAKESTLKALGVGLRVDCRTVNVGPIEGLCCRNEGRPVSEKSALVPQSGAPVWHSLVVSDVGGRIFHGWWEQTGCFLRTLVASPPSTQPDILMMAV